MTEDQGTVKQRRQRTNRLLKKQAQEGGLDKVTKRKLEELRDANIGRFSSMAKRKFVELARTLMEKNNLDGINIWDLEREAAYQIGITTQTVKMYIDQHTASTAPFMKWGKLLLLNPNYQPEEDEEGANDEDRG
jgi:hypothetical protein